LYQSLSSGAELWRRYASSSASIRYKLLANVAINGMSALLETKNGFVDANPYAHEAARMLVERPSWWSTPAAARWSMTQSRHGAFEGVRRQRSFAV